MFTHSGSWVEIEITEKKMFLPHWNGGSSCVHREQTSFSSRWRKSCCPASDHSPGQSEIFVLLTVQPNYNCLNLVGYFGCSSVCFGSFKTPNSLFRNRSKTNKTNVLFRIVPKLVSVPISVVSNRTCSEGHTTGDPWCSVALSVAVTVKPPRSRRWS